MIRAGSGLSLAADALTAGREAATQAVSRCEGAAETLLVFASHHHAPRLAAVMAGAREAASGAFVTGCAGYAVLTEEAEVEAAPAVAVLAIQGIGVAAVQHQGTGDARELGEKLATGLGDLADPRAVVLLPGPDAGWPEEIMQGLVARRLAGTPVFGAGLSGPWDAPATAVGPDIQPDASLAWGLGGDWQATYACSPGLGRVGGEHAISAARGDRLESIDGQPALAVLEAVVGAERVAAIRAGDGTVFVVVPREASAVASGHDPAEVRPIVGLDDKTGALIIAGLPPHIAARPAGVPVSFQVREGALARTDFGAMLGRLAAEVPSPSFGLFFNCAARGTDLYGAPSVDVAAIRERFPGMPVAGLFGAFELCPTEGRNAMHAYTGVLLLASATTTAGLK